MTSLSFTRLPWISCGRLCGQIHLWQSAWQAFAKRKVCTRKNLGMVLVSIHEFMRRRRYVNKGILRLPILTLMLFRMYSKVSDCEL